MAPSPVTTVRALLEAREFREADRAAARALAELPQDAELATEATRLDLLFGRFEAAYRRFPACGGPHLGEVAGWLADHLASRRAVDLEVDPDLLTAAERVAGRAGRATVQLTACLIARDEEVRLPACLDSLRGAVDRIVVVDTGSTDATVEIAERFGATVGRFTWCDDFAAARNHALELCEGDWVLWIDADERLTPESVGPIREAMTRPWMGGYSIEIANFLEDDAESATFEHHPVRLFRRHPKARFEGRIHEQIYPSLERQGLPMAELPGARILHDGYRPAEMIGRDKLTRTVRMLEREVREHPNDGFQWFNLANAYVAGRRWVEADHAARMALRTMDDASPYLELTAQLLCNALFSLDRAMEAVTVCEQVATRGAGGVLVQFEWANALLRTGRIDEALAAIDRCMALPWPAGGTGDRAVALYKRNVLRGQILAVLGRHDEALAEFDWARGLAPEFAPAHYSRAATLESMGRFGEAIAGFERVADEPTTRALALKGIGRCRLAQGEAEAAAQAFEAAWREDAADSEAWVGWAQSADAWGDAAAILRAYEAYAEHWEPTPEVLINWGRALEVSGEFDRALACLTEAVRRAPHNANAYFNCGDLLYRAGAFEDAALLFEAGLRIDPNHAQGWFVLGNALARMGLDQGAAVSYEQCLRLQPAHFEAGENLRTILQAA